MDYCLLHPGMEREAEALEARMQAARAELLAVAKEVNMRASFLTVL